MTNLDQIYKNILIYAAAAVLVVGIVIACVGIVPLYRHYRVHAEKDLVDVLAAKRVSIDQCLARAADISLQITSRSMMRTYLEKYNRREINQAQLADYTNPKLEDAMNLSENVEGISRFDPNGNLIAKIGLALPPEYVDVPVDPDQQVSFSGPVQIEGKTYLIVVASIINRENNRVGTDVVLFNADFLRKVLQDKSGLGATGKAILAMGLDNDVHPIFSAEEPCARDKAVFPVDSWIRSALMAAIAGKKGLLSPKGDRNLVIAYGPVTHAGWGLAILMTKKEVYRPATNVLIFFGGLSTIFILIAVLGTIFVFQPLTTRLKKEFAARRKSEEKLQFFKTLVDQAQDAIFIISPDTGQFIETNDQASESLGYTSDELLAMKVSDIETALADKTSFNSLIKKIRKKGFMLFDGEHKRKDGSCIPVEVSIKHAFLEGHEYIIASARDICDKLQARRHANDLVKIVEDSLNEIYIFDCETLLFLVVNRGARKNLGYSLEEMQQFTPLNIKPEYTLDSFKAILQPLVSGAVQTLELYTSHKRKDGSFYPVEIHLQVSTYAEKQVFAAIVLDITERKRSEDELKKYRGNLEEKIKERTAELEEKYQELEEMNKLFVDREFRIKELRVQVTRLQEQVQRP